MTKNKPQVLVLGNITYAHQEVEELSKVAEVIKPTLSNRKDFLQFCESGSLNRVVAIWRTWASAAYTGDFDEGLIKQLPSNIKFICHNGAGYDQIDVRACTEKGIRVAHVPRVGDDATADTNMFLILGALKLFNQPMTTLRSGQWRGHPWSPFGHDPQGKILGILGMGGIGRKVAHRAAAFGMTIQYHNRNELCDELAGGAKYIGFEELLRTSDVISLNLPLTKSTHHIISHPQFALMKDGVVIVNTSRGAILHESALVSALESGKVRSAGLDVFEEEPAIHEGLLKNQSVMLLPHFAALTVETAHRTEVVSLRNARLAVMEGRVSEGVGEQRGLWE